MTKNSQIHNELIDKLKALIPEAFSEGKIDWEKLKATLGEDINFINERYVLNWAGKSDAFRVLREPSTQTLIPAKEESINFDKTENIFIEGENLEVLKILQKSYFGKIKMIYIDPPYNTGNDSFIYPDKFSETKEDYQKRVGDKDENGYMTREGFYQKNSKENGQYHSNWLNMMYPRLFLARNLLKDDGVIFVSIDDNEVHNLRLIMNEIFGEENFLGCAGRITKKSNNKGDFWSPNFDYLLTYARSIKSATKFFGGVNYGAYNLIEKEGLRKGEKYQLVRMYMSSLQNRNPEQRFFINCPDGSKVIPPGSTFPPERPKLGDGIWRWTKSKMETESDKIVIKKVKSSNLITEQGDPAKWNIYTKTYLSDVIANSSAKPNSLIENHINQIGSHEINSIEVPFDFPKPSTLIQYLIEISKSNENEIILDFFAGSGTTAQAVMNINAKDNGKRKYICVQLPEKTDKKSEAYQAGYKNIADIAKERIRRVIKKINEEMKGKLDFTPDSNRNLGFKVFKLSDSNFKQWNGQGIKTAKTLKKQMEFFTESLSKKALNDFIVYELLIQFGFDLNSQIKHQNEVYYINTHEMVLLLEKVSKEILSRIIKTRPQKVVALDTLFNGNDELKTNTVLQMKDAGIHFKTI